MEDEIDDYREEAKSDEDEEEKLMKNEIKALKLRISLGIRIKVS